MTQPFDYIDAVAENSSGLADAAEGDLSAPVRHCPSWTVADLVKHVTEVHWFWGTIASERLSEPPDESRRPPAVPQEDLVENFRGGADRLVGILRAADPSAQVWTWAPAQHDIAFISRHQVQEAAVHHWDAVDATGGTFAIPPLVAADSVEEFLTFSVSSESDPADPPRPPLDGELGLACSDIDAAWTVTDGASPGTVAFSASASAGTGGAPASGRITATASDLLLWLYGRVELDTSGVADGVLERFRALCFTD